MIPPMTPDKSDPNGRESGRAGGYHRLRALFEQCVDLPEGARLDWIERNIPDESTRLELALMLASDASDNDVFEAPAMQRLGDFLDRDELELPDLIGTRCGPFRLVRLLGSGGQGAVYLGAREDAGFSQNVAIKLMRRVFLDHADLRRFRRERDILARFDHPGVARLIDAGLGENGLPYLAMEYVDGEPIDVWCLQQAADQALRLRLIEELCDVAAAAHRQLIVHRDLKPSNVLVNAEGRIKVLDFGIARLLSEEGDTRTHASMHTPGYGSPEQRNGDPVAPASDVFALGVLLRELIAGQAPPRRDGEAWPDWPEGVPHELRWIFERCCSPDPGERYRDAAELREDIERQREQRPVLAHPPSGLYRARKFVARHRGGVAITALLLITTVIGFGSALWQTRVAQQHSARATQEAERARGALARAEAVRDFMLEVFETGGAGLPPDQLPDTATLLERGRKTALAATTQSPQTRADMLAFLGRIYLGLQRENLALELQNEALALIESQSPRDDKLYATTLVHRGDVQGRLGDLDAALADFDAALALQERTDPSGLDRLETLRSRGEQLAFAGRIEPALSDFEQALKLASAHSEVPKSLLAEIHNSYGVALWRIGDCARGESELRQAVALAREAWGDSHAATAGGLSALSLCLTQSGKLEESEQISHESLAILTRVFGEHHPALGQSRNNLANLLIKRGRLNAALPLLREKLDADRVSGVDLAGSGLNTWINLSNVLRSLGDLDGAAKAATTALDIGRRVGPDSPVGREPELLLARVALERADPVEAQTWIDSYRRWMHTPEGAHALMPARVDLLEARVAIAKQDRSNAERLATIALGRFNELGCSDVSPFAAAVAHFYREQGEDAAAGALLDRAVDRCEQSVSLTHYAAVDVLLARAAFRLAQQDRAGAQIDADLAEAALAAELPAEHPRRLQLIALRQHLARSR